jgi:hypothetical protein
MGQRLKGMFNESTPNIQNSIRTEGKKLYRNKDTYVNDKFYY